MTDYARKMSLDLRYDWWKWVFRSYRQQGKPLCEAAQWLLPKVRYTERYTVCFSDLGTYKPGEWNVYSEIKRKLVEDYHIPSYEIRFIQECKNEKAKKAMVDAMNRGDIRIIFGSTSMLGTSVNAQQRAVAVHHWTRLGDLRT